ncbi:MAG: flagellar motor switch protein FliN [Treponema sp.]|uniref:flagellar motor switch protein FliN n=1 Tax=Treponema sp. TaxID=166 RepID=UPI001B4EB184|nr:flagellar motor switch protein FliN [Treponema sp.]MBP5402500.1 flagellar motor switch protein FliN [Treponema sp.]MBR5933120.1 flagellar motor switch protein FliN [Treponema sp.]
MSDGAISQDEIDALLSGVPIDGLNASGQVTNGPSVNIDAVALGKFADELKQPFADNLKKMTGVDCTAQNVVVEASVRDQLLAKLPEMVIAVMADFSNALTGDHIYIISTELAQKLVSLINKEENATLDDMSLSIISETLSTHTNDEITALDKTQKFAGLACNPAEAVSMPKAMVRIPQNTFALFTYPVTLDGTPYTIWEAIAGEAAVQIGRAYGADDGTAGALNAADMASMQSLAGGMPMGGQPQMGIPQMGMGQPMMNGMMGMPQMGGVMPMNTPNVQTLQYPNLQGGMPSAEQGNISLIMDVFMEMTVELGRTKKQIRDILGMGEGTIIELDKLAGEPVDILVNHKPIAKGEVVVIDENFGVRVTEILSPLERVSDLH